MRLIDADKLQDDGANYSYDKSENFSVIGTEYRFVNRVQIDNAPTVEAIPIEWLKKHSWYGVIEHWEKDQKLNNSKEVLYSLLKDHGFNSYNEYINWAEAIMAIPRDDRVKFLEKEREDETC